MCRYTSRKQIRKPHRIFSAGKPKTIDQLRNRRKIVLGIFTSSYNCTYEHLELSSDKFPEKTEPEGRNCFRSMPKNHETKTLFAEKKSIFSNCSYWHVDCSFDKSSEKKLARDAKFFPHHVQKPRKKDTSFEKNDSSQSVPMKSGRTDFKCLSNKHCQKSTKFDPK